MIVNKDQVSKIAKGVLLNSTDIGYWNALEDYCRDQEMTFQIGCFDYLNRLKKYQDHIVPLTGDTIGYERRALFSYWEYRRPPQNQTSYTSLDTEAWHTPWFDKRYYQNKGPLGIRGWFPNNCHTIARIFAAWLRFTEGKTYPCLQVEFAGLVLGAMKLVDHRTRDWSIASHSLDYINLETNTLLAVARSGRFGHIRRAVHAWFQDNHKVIDRLLAVEAMVKITQDWVKEQIKDHPLPSA